MHNRALSYMEPIKIIGTYQLRTVALRTVPSKLPGKGLWFPLWKPLFTSSRNVFHTFLKLHVDEIGAAYLKGKGVYI